MSGDIGVDLLKLISADRQGSNSVCAVGAVWELVREKIIIRHDPLRSPTHCFEPKPERMYGLQESADCPTKDDDIGFSSWNAEGSTQKRKRSETYFLLEISGGA